MYDNDTNDASELAKKMADKSLLTLSVGAVGLLVTLLTTVGVESVMALFLFGGAIFSFAVCLGSVLAILWRNGDYLEKLVSGNKPSDDPLLKSLDLIARTSFIFGIILAAIIGMATGATQIIQEEKSITEEKRIHKLSEQLIETKSFDGANRIAPKSDSEFTESFNGAQRVAPPKEEDNGHSPLYACPNGGKRNIVTALYSSAKVRGLVCST